MYTRISLFNFNPEKLDEMESRLVGIGEQLKSIDGILDTYVFWNADGSGTSVAIYEDLAAADAASETIKAIWGGLMDLLTGPPAQSTYLLGWHLVQ